MGNLKFNIDDTCVKCGACAVDCPVQCITKGETQFNIGQRLYRLWRLLFNLSRWSCKNV